MNSFGDWFDNLLLFLLVVAFLVSLWGFLDVLLNEGRGIQQVTIILDSLGRLTR